MPRALFILFVLIFPSLCRGADRGRSWVIEGFDTEAARECITRYGTTGLEGLWLASEDGATVAIIPADAPEAAGIGTDGAASVIFVIVESPRPAISPGTVLGWAKVAAKPGKWDATIFTRHNAGVLSAPKPFTITVADDNHITLMSARNGFYIRPRISLPFLGRIGIYERHEREKDLDGFIRVWPPSPTTPPPFPVYL